MFWARDFVKNSAMARPARLLPIELIYRAGADARLRQRNEQAEFPAQGECAR
jgi:hypothetical protein